LTELMSKPSDPDSGDTVPRNVWKRTPDIEAMNRRCAGTLVDHLGMRLVDVGPDWLRGTLPVDDRTKQPLGLLHGGATAALVETLGSVAAAWAVDEQHYCVGIEINVNHIRSARSGQVIGTARAIQTGRRIQVWQVDVEDEAGRLISTGRLTLAVLQRDTAH
jgi:1,4-dihydroxy-2-naphthoyl-CoA hydrolase